MVMIRQYGDGRVFNCTLGHDVRALKTEMVSVFYRRGCAWAAGLPPVPPTGPLAK
jgi:type 1 glutamine amidotransferase